MKKCVASLILLSSLSFLSMSVALAQSGQNIALNYVVNNYACASPITLRLLNQDSQLEHLNFDGFEAIGSDSVQISEMKIINNDTLVIVPGPGCHSGGEFSVQLQASNVPSTTGMLRFVLTAPYGVDSRIATQGNMPVSLNNGDETFLAVPR